MTSESSLSFVSLVLSYLGRSAAAYLCLWVLCRSIRSSQLRFWLYSLYLSGLVTSWAWVFLSPHLASLPLTEAPVARLVSARNLAHYSWSFSVRMSALDGRVFYRARWAYELVLAFLLLRFGAHFWQVRNLLGGSEKAPDELSNLFESVRLRTGAAPCELRFVADLRSPATTGWWRPKVLLPRALVPRLGTQQLTHIFKHELGHVRRRDYLWDRLATVGCYLTFFHPLAWLARRRLRWERELACDESAAPAAHEERVDYASCLTALASWWFLEDEIGGQVDFLSSPPSFLAARVRALLVARPAYGCSQKAALLLLSAAALSLSVVLVPGIAISGYRPAPLDSISNAAVQPSKTAAATRTGRRRVSKQRRDQAVIIPAAAVGIGSSPPNLEPPVQLPILSSPALDPGDSYAAGSDASALSRNPDSEAIWDESRPQPPRRRGSKVGTVALRVIRGVGVLAIQLHEHEHEK